MATPYCTMKPRPGSYMGAACDACGHALALHIGVEHCPVCEMADLNAKTWHEKLLSGEKSINDRRRAVGVPPPDVTGPEVGATVHYLRAAAGNLYCLPASVGGIQADGRLNLDTLFGTPGPAFIDAVEEDPFARTGGTWHRPCEKAEPDPEPEPEALPTTVTIHVHGGVFTDRDLRDIVERGVLRRGMRQSGATDALDALATWSPYRRR